MNKTIDPKKESCSKRKIGKPIWEGVQPLLFSSFLFSLFLLARATVPSHFPTLVTVRKTSRVNEIITQILPKVKLSQTH
jgi:hypothetical protein